ncbi:MAG: amidohydrolase [Clostridia bacterium]|nr:amidohydrolase [Clostridia bacterium]
MQEFQKTLEEIFRDFHRHPETAKEEYRTTQKVREFLEKQGIQILDLPLPTGVLAQVGSGEGPVIALRADMDALPVQEQTDLPYVSETPGKMHACGHDFHTTALLGAAALLKEREAELKGTVRLIFQPGEEINYGALAMLGTGLLDDVQEYYGLHTDPNIEAGTLGIRENAIMASPDWFGVTIEGKGGHGAQPHNCIDPVPAMASLILALQQVVSRRISPFSACVLSVTRASAGNTWNVIPGTAEIEGTIRTMSDEERDLGEQLIRQTAESVAVAYGCTAKVGYKRQSRPLINTPALAAFATGVAEEMGIPVIRQEPSMIGEDFAEYLKDHPGCFVRVGTGIGPALHHPKFTVDPSVLSGTAEFLARTAQKRLEALRNA